MALLPGHFGEDGVESGVAITINHARGLERENRSGPIAGPRISADAGEVSEDLRLFLENDEQPQMLVDVIPSKPLSLANVDAFHIDPVS